MGEAERLVRDGISDELVISTPFGEPGDICRNPPTGLTVTCFVPDPSTTRGEAQEIGRLAKQRGWTAIAVVTWPTHVSRSRMLIGRCFDGDVQMVSYDDHMGTQGRINENLYQSGAFLKAFVATRLLAARPGMSSEAPIGQHRQRTADVSGLLRVDVDHEHIRLVLELGQHRAGR